MSYLKDLSYIELQVYRSLFNSLWLIICEYGDQEFYLTRFALLKSILPNEQRRRVVLLFTALNNLYRTGKMSPQEVTEYLGDSTKDLIVEIQNRKQEE